jgi:hypothetical protein
MIRTKRFLTLLLSLLLGACVTINIYFPSAAAEQAADRIIQDVWGATAERGSASPPFPDTGSSPAPEASLGTWVVQSGMVYLLATPVYAQVDFTISTPAIDKLTNTMKARHSKLEPYYQSSAIGLTNDALVVIRNPTAIPLNERNTVRQLVANENSDRNALYREIARANGHPEWENNIRETFARRWVANAAPGWWYQNSAGVWQQKDERTR